MAKHAVIGAGNLGVDLAKKLSQEYEVKMFSAVNGLKYPQDPLIDHVMEYMPDYVWCTIGAGSVGEAKKDFVPFADLHYRLIAEFAQKLSSNVFFQTFTTDYVTYKLPQGFAASTCKSNPEGPRSLYALSKWHMEEMLFMLNRPRTNIIRVGSLYGLHKPNRCFPWRLKEKNMKPGLVKMPSNAVTPTPTWWIADVICENLSAFNKAFEHTYTYHIAPRNPSPLAEWAKLVLGNEYEIVDSGEFDKERPELSDIGCSFSQEPHDWKTLWNTDADKWQDILSKIQPKKGHQ